jgi:hypothetical protein
LVFPEKVTISDKDDKETVLYSSEKLRILDRCDSRDPAWVQ